MFKLITAFVKKELVQALRDPRMKFALFVTPVVQLVIFGLALQIETRNVKLYARPMMNDKLFADISRDAIGSGWFNAVDRGDEVFGEDIDDFKSGKLDIALYAPSFGLTRQFEKGEAALEAVIDGSDLIRARSINGYINNVVSEAVTNRLGKPNDYMYQESAQSKLSSTVRAPMEFMVRVLYNPEFVTSYNLVPGVICMITCIITIMLTSMSIAKEKEIGTFETLISAPVTISEILLGKTIPYLIISAINLPMIFFVAVAVFGVPMKGGYLSLGVATFFFLVTTVSIGTLISTIARNQQQAMMGSFIFLMPAILLSGIMYPIDNLPAFLKLVSWFNPLMYYTILLRNIMLKGGDLFVVVTYTAALFLISVISVGAASKKFKLHLG